MTNLEHAMFGMTLIEVYDTEDGLTETKSRLDQSEDSDDLAIFSNIV